MVLMDTWSVAAVTTALDGLADRSLVVIRRDEADLAIYYALDVGSVRMALHEVDPEADLTSALGLSVFPANHVIDLEDLAKLEEPPARGLRPGDVLVQNVVNVLGVVRTDPGDATMRGDVSGSFAFSPAGPPGPGQGTLNDFDGGASVPTPLSRRRAPPPSGSSSRCPSAQAFAEMVMAQLPEAEGSKALPNVVRGMGMVINRPIPVEFWAAVEATWRTVPEGESPSLLIITSEPFVPWELAWVDAASVDPALFPDGMPEGPLGAMWQVGRWVPPMRRRRGPDRPPTPPQASIDVDAMAVVIGDYAADQNIRELPSAVDEGRSIALRYRGMPLTVSEGDVDRLMNAELERDGAPYAPQAVHFASHGEVSTDQQQYTGIILTGGRRLDILTVEGSRVGQASGPFVFLNACQVGTASSILSSYGGLAGAFLGAGCRGFLAPLWNVDDDVAKEIALSFYDSTLRQGLPVGEAVRRIRAEFGDGGKGSATPLAYVFYGHPELRMNWTGRPSVPARDESRR
jgi:hypothetical protein